MTVKTYISKLEQSYMGLGYPKQTVDALITGFKLGCEFAGKLASSTIDELLVQPFSEEDNILKDKKS